MNNSTVKNV